MTEISILSGSKEQSQVGQHVSHSKVMKTAPAISYYYHLHHQALKQVLTEQKSHAAFSSMCSMHQHQMTFTYFARQTQESLRSMRFRSLGLNKLTRQCRRRRNAGSSKFCGTFCPHTRFRPKSRGPDFPNRWKQSSIHSFRAVSGSKNICIPERVVSGTSKRRRNNCRQLNSIHYLHDAAGGRQFGCNLQSIHKTIVNMLGG